VGTGRPRFAAHDYRGPVAVTQMDQLIVVERNGKDVPVSRPDTDQVDFVSAGLRVWAGVSTTFTSIDVPHAGCNFSR
jgi:hypothetical protein